MRRDLGGALRVVVVATLVLAGVVGLFPGRAGPAVRIYALVLCAVAVGLALTALRRAYPAATPLRPETKRPRARRSPPPSLARIEHDAALGVASAFDLHFRLVPRLRGMAAGLLATRRAISLETNPDAARRLLGAETWEYLRRGSRTPPEDRLARGIPTADLSRVVESLERI